MLGMEADMHRHLSMQELRQNRLQTNCTSGVKSEIGNLVKMLETKQK